MPGIAGFIAAAGTEPHPQKIGQMLGCMLHEPTYTSGSYVEQSIGLEIGWVCHKGSFSDCLPIWNENHDVCLIFSGEDFTESAKIKNLKTAGHDFGPNASYLVHLYEEKGDRFFETLNGVFSGVIVDLRGQKKVILFNDRYGLSRVYCHEAAEGFYFSSEAKAILQVKPQLRQLETQGLGELFTLGCVMQDRSLFKEIFLLPPASVWTFNDHGRVRKGTFFSKEAWEQQEKLSADDYYERLKEIFSRVLPRYFRDNGRLAMSLTGGLDSRIIMAWAQCQPNSLPCYSHRGMFNECADASIARRIAGICHQPHRNITLDENFLAKFSSLAAQTIYLTDGAMEVGGAAGLYANKVARNEIAPVRMTGNYGSEILRNNIAFKPKSLNQDLFEGGFIPHLKNASATYFSEKKNNPASFIPFKQVPWHHFSRFALESSQLTVRSPYLDNELVALSFQAPFCITVNQLMAARLIADGNPALASFPTDRGPLGRSGAFGKVRKEFQEFTFKAEYAYDYGMPQWLAKMDRVVKPLRLEKLFLGRHKYYHFRYWYRNELAPFVKEVLLDQRALSRPYLNRKNVEQMVSAHVNGTGNYTSEIHTLLTGELIHRQLIEKS